MLTTTISNILCSPIALDAMAPPTVLIDAAIPLFWIFSISIGLAAGIVILIVRITKKRKDKKNEPDTSDTDH